MKVATLSLFAIALCIVSPASTLRIKTHDEGLSGMITASPTLIYRRRLNSDRYQSIYPPPTAPSNSIEETKTDADNNGVTDDPPPPTSSSRPRKIKSRRHRARVRTVALPQTIVEDEKLQQYTPKPTKPKGSRRRKVKRPTKNKQHLTKTVVDNELSADKSNSTSSGGDKNLALEIGSEDGKYALIDKFFDKTLSTAPGLVSYSPSADFPRNDNKHTLGNVKQNDIWLSDGHLLVLKGGDLDASLREHWNPIDNYQRGNRPPLRIALDSDNPPPFPVFTNETGPPVFLGPPPPFIHGYPYPPPGAFNETFDPSRFPPPGMVPLYPNVPGPFGGSNNNSLFPAGPLGQYGGAYGHGTNNASFPSNRFPPPPPFFPFPPPGHRNGSRPPIFLPPPPGFNRNFTNGPPFPFLPPLVLNPNDNETDDPSIFLPPPYDFDYQDDNSTLVPPGPFAPGLVVPPPRDFYTVYNKTTNRPTLPPATGLSYSFGNKRPQRPNAKKPRFPITNPPDDSEELYQPLTTPYSYPQSEAPLKKRKRPAKVNKGLFAGTKYEADTDIGNVVIAPQSPPILPLQVTPQPPLINIPVIRNTIVPIIETTPNPLNNYVYVRGQLKSLAELNRPQEQEGYEYEVTPRPPYDEHGYPTRVIDDNEHTVVQYNKKPSEVPPKSYYYNTPKYDAIYSTYTKKPKKVQTQHYYNENENPVSQRPQLPIAHDQQSPIYLNNRLSNQDQGAYAHGGNTFQETGTPADPSYYNNQAGGLQQKPVIQLQSPKSYSINNNRQPHLYNRVTVPQNLNYQTTSQFRPAFGPSIQQQQQQQQKPRSNKVQFPAQVSQNGQLFDFRNQLFQQQQQQGRPQVDGYYSPITQYYQPLQQTQPQQNNFYPNPQRYFNSQNQNLNAGYQQQQQQQPQFRPYYPQQSQSQGSGQVLSNEYRSPLQQQFLPQSQQTPIRQDVYVNYREPLPQYNTESEAVTTRTIFGKAGPSKAPLTGAETKNGVSADGSYYSFQRGGPGGFSYKIKL